MEAQLVPLVALLLFVLTVWVLARVEVAKAVKRAKEVARQIAEGREYGPMTAAVKMAKKKIRGATKHAVENVREAAGRAVESVLRKAEPAIGRAAKEATERAEEVVQKAAEGVAERTDEAARRAVKKIAKEAGEVVDRVVEGATGEAQEAIKRAEDDAPEPRPTSPAPAFTSAGVPTLWLLLLLAAASVAIYRAGHPWHLFTRRTDAVADLLVDISPGVSNSTVEAIDNSIASIIADTIPAPVCARTEGTSFSPPQDSVGSISEYLVRYRLPAMGLCTTIRTVVRHGQRSGVLRIDKATDIVAWRDNENADGTMVMAVAYDALPGRRATKDDLWPVAVSLLAADSVLTTTEAGTKNFVMTFTNLHEWRRLRASSRDRSVIDKGTDNYFTHLDLDVDRAPFLPFVPPEQPQLTIGALGPSDFAYPERFTDGSVLGVSLLRVNATPLGATPMKIHGIVRMPKRDRGSCCENDQLVSATHDMLARANTASRGDTSTAVVRLDWLDRVFAMMGIQSVSRRDRFESWLPNIMWGLSISFTFSLLVLGIQTIRQGLRTKIDYAQRTIDGIEKQVRVRKARIDELLKTSEILIKKQDASGKRIGTLKAEIGESKRRWSSLLKLTSLIGIIIMHSYRRLRGRLSTSRLRKRQDTQKKLEEDRSYMNNRLEKHKAAEDPASSAMLGDLWALFGEAAWRGGLGIVLAGSAFAVIATIAGFYAGHLGGAWWTLAIATAVLWALPFVVCSIVDRPNPDDVHCLTALALGVVGFMYLYLSYRAAIFPEEKTVEWTFNVALINLMIFGAAVVLAVGQFVMGRGHSSIEDDESKIIRRTLNERISGTSSVDTARRIGLAIVYLSHLLLLFGTEAVALIQEASIIGSRRSLASAMPIGTVTFVAMALPVAVLFRKTNGGT